MAAPTFTLVQGVTGWTSAGVYEISNTSGAGAQLSSLTTNINFSNVNSPQGYQSSNAFSAAHPVAVGSNSYEFVWGLKVTSIADNAISNFKVWGGGSNPTGVTVYVGAVAAGSFTTPVTTTSTKATTSLVTVSSSSPITVSSSIANTVGTLSDCVYMQAQTTGSAAGGNQSPMPTVYFSIQWN